MNIKLGIYDIFSYAVPGGLFLLTMYFSASLWIPFTYSEHWNSLDFSSLLLIDSLSYVIGYVVVALSDALPWHLFTRLDSPSKKAFEEVSENYPELKFGFEHNQWTMLQSNIWMKCPDLAARADKHRAVGIMLRSTAFCFLVCSLVVITYATHKREWIYLTGAGVFLILVISSIRSSYNFLEWSYKSLFETTIALSGYADDVISHIKDPNK